MIQPGDSVDDDTIFVYRNEAKSYKEWKEIFAESGIPLSFYQERRIMDLPE